MKEPGELRHVFKEYDVRGKAGVELDAAFARRLGRAYARFLAVEAGVAVSPDVAVAVGRDCRLSSPELMAALSEGLAEAGLTVYDVGMVPTPVLYFATHMLDVAGGIMITASHNPPDENGFKIVLGTQTIASEQVQRLYDLFAEDAPPACPRAGAVIERPVTETYLQRLQAEFGPEFSRLRGGARLRVAVDAGNGAAGPVMAELLARLGIEAECLYCEPDGRFPNHQPDPTVPALMRDLASVVREGGLDLGIGLDGDGDRLGVVDETGELIWGDRLMILFARQVLAEKPGATVVGEVKCTNCLFEEVEKHGGRPVMWKAGHSLVKRKMREEGAALGGEMSGHYFFADRYYGFDDAVYAAFRFLEVAADAKAAGRKVSQLLADLPPLCSTGEVRIPVEESIKNEVVEELVRLLPEHELPGWMKKRVVTTDGIRLEYDRGWALVRPSNTQAVVVMRFEAYTPEDLAFLEKEFRGLLERVVERPKG
jgi:phosphomannomutase/phosphoglucomutase